MDEELLLDGHELEALLATVASHSQRQHRCGPPRSPKDAAVEPSLRVSSGSRKRSRQELTKPIDAPSTLSPTLAAWSPPLQCVPKGSTAQFATSGSPGLCVIPEPECKSTLQQPQLQPELARAEGNSSQCKSGKDHKMAPSSPQRDELRVLHQQVAQLQLQLKQLQLERAHVHGQQLYQSQTVPPSCVATIDITHGRVLSNSKLQLWRRLAVSQRLGRQQAESENEELKRQIRLHAKVIRELQLQLSRRMSTLHETMQSALSIQPRDLDRQWDTIFASEIYELLAAQTVSLDSQLDQVFEANGLTYLMREIDHQCRVVQTESSSSTPFYLQLCQVVHWPNCDASTAFEAIWQGLSSGCEPHCFQKRKAKEPSGQHQFEDDGEPEDLRWFSACVPIVEENAVSESQVVLRRFPPDAKGRALIGWKSFAQLSSLSTQQKLFNLTHTGWMTVEQMTLPDSNCDVAAIKKCVQVVPILNSSPMQPDPPLCQEQFNALLQRIVNDLFRFYREYLDKCRLLVCPNVTSPGTLQPHFQA